jgi:hypothetical protein
MPMRDPSSHDAGLRVARIGAVAGLLGALIGALVAGVPVLVSTSMQISAASEQSRSEFLREERKAAYADVFAKSEEFRDDANTFAEWFPYRDESLIREKSEGMDLAASALWDSVISVRLVASPDVAAAARQLVARRSEYWAALRRAASATLEAANSGRSGVDLEDLGDPAFQSILPYKDQYDAAHDEFVAKARLDLGIDLPR